MSRVSCLLSLVSGLLSPLLPFSRSPFRSFPRLPSSSLSPCHPGVVFLYLFEASVLAGRRLCSQKFTEAK
jgi:hypothetical protein